MEIAAIKATRFVEGQVAHETAMLSAGDVKLAVRHCNAFSSFSPCLRVKTSALCYAVLMLLQEMKL